MIHRDDDIKVVAYRISSELGELETKTYRVKSSEGEIWDSGRTFYEGTKPLERFKSNRYMELALECSVESSCRRSAARLNRVRNEKEGVGATTYRNTIEREGQKIQAKIEEKVDKILSENGISEDGKDIDCSKIKREEIKHIEENIVEEAAKEIKISEYKASDYESKETSVNISIDEVVVNRQSETRPTNEKSKQKKRVDNAVIQVQNENGRYILNSMSVTGAIKQLIGFLVSNGQMWREIVIFADGARSINSAVKETLGYARYKIIMDWYHLGKKCRGELSMGLRGREVRNEIAGEMMGKLWRGDVEGALLVLGSIEAGKIKDGTKITDLREYLGRIREHVPCYALRKKLGLRNSSNQGEKANDLIVSKRQKRNGMSWSDDGSFAFASVAAASFNGELQNWLCNRDLSFKLLPFSA